MSPAIAFVGPSYQTRSPSIANDRCVNLFPELVEFPRGNKIEVMALYSVPGIATFVGLGGAIRGMLTAVSGRCFVVSGSTLYELFANGTFATRGTLNTGSGRVGMAENGLQLMLVDGPGGYVLNFASNTLVQITDESFLGGSHVIFVDGFFAVNRPDTGQWQISENPYEGQFYDATDIVTAESKPDPIVALAEFRREVWTIGTRSTEVWFNQGLADFPFVRIPGAVHQEGTIAPGSVARLGNEGLAWLGQSEDGFGIVWRTVGYQLQRISTHAIEAAIKDAEAPEDALAWSYQTEGHVFYLLNVGGHTWGYDVNTGLWHERAMLDEHGRTIPLTLYHHCVAFGQSLVGGDAGVVYRMAHELYSWDGQPLQRLRQWQPAETGDRKQLYHHELEVLMETGVGLEGDGQGSDPMIMLQWSDDDGRTWSNERWKRIGAMGEFDVQVTWTRLGRSLKRIYRCVVSDPVDVVFLGADLRATGAAS